MIGHAHTFDPGEPGGGTFQVQVSGDVITTLDSGTVLGEGTWSVTPGSGTEEYEGLSGRGPAFVLIEPGSAVIVYSGTVTPAE